MLRLRIHVPNQPPREVTVDGCEAVLGRASGEVLIATETVSKRHAKILCGLVVADLGSTNGVWIDGKQAVLPVVLQTQTFYLGSADDSVRVDVVDTDLKKPEEVARLTSINEQLTRRVEELEKRLEELQRPPIADNGAGEMTVSILRPSAVDASPRQTTPAAEAVRPVPAEAPPAPEPAGTPSWDRFFSVHRSTASAVYGSVPDVRPGSAPPIPAYPVRSSALGQRRAAVLEMIDRLIKDDVKDSAPLLDGPVEQFFTLECFRVLRHVETATTYLAREFVELYEMKTILPGQQNNFRGMAADILTDPGSREHRQRLVSYLEQLRHWLGVILAANRYAAVEFVQRLRADLTAEQLLASHPVPPWMWALGQREGELWRRARKRLDSLSESAAEDRLDELTRQYAEQQLEKR